MTHPLPDLTPGDIVPNGLYFGLDEAIYHAVPQAHGSTNLKALAIDPHEYQFDALYGEDIDSDALLFGSALHARMLEGEAALHAKFYKRFVPEGDGWLVTDDDLKQFLREHGQEAISRGTKKDRIRRVLELEPGTKILDVERARYEDDCAGKTELKPKLWAQIEVACRWVQRDPLLSAVMENGTFIDGAPEVSIFYEDDGVRLKCRFDRLLRHAIVDLKSFAPMWSGDIRQQALKAIDRHRYDLQAAAYERGWHWAREAFLDGTLAVYGTEPVDGFLKDCFDRDQPKWIWVMIKRTGAPHPLVIDWQAKLARATAADQIEEAIEIYRLLRDRHGPDVEWPPENPAFTVTDTDLPSFFGR